MNKNRFAVESEKFMNQEIVILTQIITPYFSKPRPLLCVCLHFVAENYSKTNLSKLEI